MDPASGCCESLFKAGAVISLSVVTGVAALVAALALATLFVPALFALFGLSTLTLSIIVGVSAITAVVAGIAAAKLSCSKTVVNVPSGQNESAVVAPSTPRRAESRELGGSKTVAFVSPEAEVKAPSTPKKERFDRFSKVCINKHFYFVLNREQFNHWTEKKNTGALAEIIGRHKIGQAITIGNTHLSVTIPQHTIDYPGPDEILIGVKVAVDAMTNNKQVMIASTQYVEYVRFLLYVEGGLKIREGVKTVESLKKALQADLKVIEEKLEEKIEDHWKEVILDDWILQMMLKK